MIINHIDYRSKKEIKMVKIKARNINDIMKIANSVKQSQIFNSLYNTTF